jgi:hypothetical protein
MKDKESLRGICGWIFISGKAENCYQSADVIKRVHLPFSRTLKNPSGSDGIYHQLKRVKQ